MCISATLGWLGANAGAIGAATGALGAAASIRSQVMAGKDARGRAKEAAHAEAAAMQNANSRLAQRRTALRRNSLLTTEDQAAGMPAGGRATYGGA